MALNPTVLKNTILTEIADLSDAEKADSDAFWLMLCTAILTHIQTTGVINVTVTTAGTAAAQTGTGTGTIS